ncbi:MAG: SPASM domain-containing protein [Lentisphaerae bacterium]|nr:SPASM domain-containing protein [Lentisphaerota bacterium]
MSGNGTPERIAAELGFAWDDLLRFPKYVDLDTVNQCNARCVMCGVNFAGRPKTVMADSLFARLAAELGRHTDDVLRVGLAVNCEPLLDPQLERRVALLKAAGVRQTYVSTNASLLTAERARALLEAGLDVMYISIDSLVPSVFEAIRRGLRFDTVYRNICDYIRLKHERRPEGVVGIRMVQMDANRDEAEAFVAHWSALLGPRDHVSVSQAYNWGRAQGFQPTAEASTNGTPCRALWSSLVIGVDGKVPLCCMDSAAGTLLGDAAEQTLDEIWHGEPLARMRARHLEDRRGELPLCASCTLWRADRQVSRQPGCRWRDDHVPPDRAWTCEAVESKRKGAPGRN